MESDAYRDLGYGQPVVRRPIFDPGAYDYVEKFGRRMTRVQGLKTARSILRRQETKARGIQAQRNTDNDSWSADEARLRRRAG